MRPDLKFLDYEQLMTLCGQQQDDNRTLRAALDQASQPRQGRDSISAEPYKLIWAADAQYVVPPRTLVRGLIGAESLALIYGEPNTGKSTFALDIALSVARGADWQGHSTRRGFVAYLAGEGVHGVRSRVAAHLKHYKVSGGTTFALIPSAIDLLDDTSVSRLIATVRMGGSEAGEVPVLLVVDTVARCMSGDENSGEDMGAFIAACDRLRGALGVAVLLVHHSGKDQSRGARGHSSLRAAVDTEIQVVGSHGTRTATVLKQRDMESGQVFAFDLEPVAIGNDAEAGTAITACVARPAEHVCTLRRPTGRQQARLLVELERRHAGGEVVWTNADLSRIGREIDMPKNTARSAVLALYDAGYLIRQAGGAALAEQPGVRA